MQAGIFRRCHLSQRERETRSSFSYPLTVPSRTLLRSHILVLSSSFQLRSRFFFVRPTRLGSSLSTCSTGPGGPRTGPRRSTGISCSHGRGSSDVRCPECAATTRPPPPRYPSIFFFSLSRSSHAFHRFRSPSLELLFYLFRIFLF